MNDNRAIFPNTYSSDKEIAGTFLSAVVLKSKTNVQEQLKEFARSAGGNPDDMSAPNFIQCTENGTGKFFLAANYCGCGNWFCDFICCLWIFADL